MDNPVVSLLKCLAVTIVAVVLIVCIAYVMMSSPMAANIVGLGLFVVVCIAIYKMAND